MLVAVHVAIQLQVLWENQARSSMNQFFHINSTKHNRPVVCQFYTYTKSIMQSAYIMYTCKLLIDCVHTYTRLYSKPFMAS